MTQTPRDRMEAAIRIYEDCAEKARVEGRQWEATTLKKRVREMRALNVGEACDDEALRRVACRLAQAEANGDDDKSTACRIALVCLVNPEPVPTDRDPKEFQQMGGGTSTRRRLSQHSGYYRGW